MRKTISIFYVVVLFFVGQKTGTAGDCAIPIFSSDFSGSKEWKASGNTKFIKTNSKKVLQIDSSSFWDSSVSVKLNSNRTINKFIVVKAYVKGNKIIKNKSKYNVAKMVIELKTKNGRKRTEARFAGTFDWSYQFLVVRSPKNIKDVFLSLEHDGSSGTVYFSSIDVYSCSDKRQLEIFDYPEGWDAKINPSFPLSAELPLSNLEWTVLNKDIYGVNSEHPYLKIKYIDTLNLKSTLDLKLNVIRFPGGARANYYHWKYDGYNPKELKSFGIYKSRWSRKIFEHFSYGKNKRGLDDFSRWAKTNNVSAALVLNIVTAESVNEPVEFIEHAINQGLPVKYVELGNELYFKNQRGNNISDAEGYINAIRPIIKLIRSRYPAIKIGIPVYHGAHEWNATLKNANLNIDAIIPHAYAHTSSVASIAGDKLLFDYAKHEIPSLFEYLKAVFPNKKIWISEWNFQDRPTYRRTNSLASVIYAAHYLVSMLREPLVEYSAYHSLISKSFGLMEIENEKSFPDSLVLKYPYYFWKEIGAIFSHTSMTSDVKPVYSDNKKYQSYIDKHIRVQSFHGGKGIYLLIINDDASSVKFNVPNYSAENIKKITFSFQYKPGPVRLKSDEGTPVQFTEEPGNLTIPALSVTIAGPL